MVFVPFVCFVDQLIDSRWLAGLAGAIAALSVDFGCDSTHLSPQSL